MLQDDWISLYPMTCTCDKEDFSWPARSWELRHRLPRCSQGIYLLNLSNCSSRNAYAERLSWFPGVINSQQSHSCRFGCNNWACQWAYVHPDSGAHADRLACLHWGLVNHHQNCGNTTTSCQWECIWANGHILRTGDPSHLQFDMALEQTHCFIDLKSEAWQSRTVFKRLLRICSGWTNYGHQNLKF